MQKKIKGSINYFPLTAVQCFDTSTMRITNSIMVGNFALVKFFGPFSFNPKAPKVDLQYLMKPNCAYPCLPICNARNPACFRPESKKRHL